MPKRYILGWQILLPYKYIKHTKQHNFRWVFQDKVSEFLVISLRACLVKLAIKMVGASLVAQWLGIHLPMQGTRVRVPVREDPTCHGAARPVSHNY